MNDDEVFLEEVPTRAREKGDSPMRGQYDPSGLITAMKNDFLIQKDMTEDVAKIVHDLFPVSATAFISSEDVDAYLADQLETSRIIAERLFALGWRKDSQK